MKTPTAPAPARPVPPPRSSRPALSPWLLLAVAVLIGLGVGRFVTAGSAEPEVTTVQVAAAADLGERIDQLEQAVASDPQDLESLQGLGAAYIDRAAETGDPAFYELAGTALDRAQALRPGDSETTLVQGLLALVLHEFDDALQLGKQALELRPDSAAVLGVVVDGQVELGRYDDAATTLQDMLDRDPALPALARASYLRELNGDLGGAVTAMQQARTSGSSSPLAEATVTTLLGDLLMAQGRAGDAEQLYAEALEQAPGLVTAQVGAARAQAAGGDIAGAITTLQEMTQTQPTVGALVLLGALQIAQDDGSTAGPTVELVRTLATLQEAAGQVVDLEMALFEADYGDPARAVGLAEAANAARPDNVFTNMAMGWALHRSGDTVAALPFVEQALRLDSGQPQLRWHAAQVFADAGQDDRARESLAVVLESAPWTGDVPPQDVAALAAELGVQPPTTWPAV